MEMAYNMFKSLALLVTSPDCFDEFFINANFVHVPCLKSTLSKGLGLGIVAGSSLVKVPQVVKIKMNASAEGISIFSTLMELFAVSSATAYCYANSFPFSTYGEGVFLIIQTFLIGAMVLHYQSQRLLTLVFTLLYPAMLYLLLAGYAPMGLLWTMQSANVPIIVTAKMIQASANYRAGSTGQLAAVTVFLLFLGSLARIFTSVQDTGDITLVVTFVFNSIVNGVVAGQVLYYWNAKPAKQAKKVAGKKTKKTN